MTGAYKDLLSCYANELILEYEWSSANAQMSANR